MTKPTHKRTDSDLSDDADAKLSRLALSVLAKRGGGGGTWKLCTPAKIPQDLMRMPSYIAGFKRVVRSGGSR